jgi:hypothetical protein
VLSEENDFYDLVEVVSFLYSGLAIALLKFLCSTPINLSGSTSTRMILSASIQESKRTLLTEYV